MLANLVLIYDIVPYNSAKLATGKGMVNPLKFQIRILFRLSLIDVIHGSIKGAKQMLADFLAVTEELQ